MKFVLTPEKVVELASRNGGFEVSKYRYRDERLRKLCKKLRKEGAIKIIYRHRDFLIYGIPEYARSER